MTPQQVFQNFQLTNDQEKLLNRLDEFLRSDDQCFLLKGYAGTGKTFMMQGFVEYLKSINRSFVLCAPTGRAAKVIAIKTKHPASTIHKAIYANNDLKDYKIENEDGTETYKFFFNIKSNAEDADVIYIVDESSMTSDVYSEGEFFRFGTGHLLKDFLTYTAIQHFHYKRKVIFIGDNAQLPPVGMNNSPALDKEYLTARLDSIIHEFHLKEVVRQEGQSQILKNSITLRQSIEKNSFTKLELDLKNNSQAINNDSFLDTYLKVTRRKIDDNSIVIAYSNRKVKNYNDKIREHFFPNKQSIQPNDRILVVANNYNYRIELMNGDFGKVISVEPDHIQRTITLKKPVRKGFIDVPIDLTFRKVVIAFEDIGGFIHNITCLVIENLLYSEEANLSSDERKALYIDFWIRHPKLDKIRRLLQARSIKYKDLEMLIENLGIGDVTREVYGKLEMLKDEYYKNNSDKSLKSVSLAILKEVLKADPYFNALNIKFGYAVTCHKSQGGEWDNVFVDCYYHSKRLTANYFRWLYTAITRAKEQLFLMNHENIGVNDGLIIVEPNQENIGNVEKLEKLVKAVLGDRNIIVENIKVKGFSHQVKAKKDTSVTTVNIYHKKNGKITSITPSGKATDFQQEVINVLGSLKGKNIGTEEKEQPTLTKPEFPSDKSFLEDFYQETITKIDRGINVDIVLRRQYLERYSFVRGAEKAVLDFYYNGKNQFTRCVPIPSQSNSESLLSEIKNALGNL